MDTKELKPKKVKKDTIEIRFSVSENDGNLKEMLDKVPNGCYTDFTKQALRYYLKAVRDKKVECDFLKPNVLDEFRADLKPENPSLDDIVRLLQVSNGRVDMTLPAQTVSLIDTRANQSTNTNLVATQTIEEPLETVSEKQIFDTTYAEDDNVDDDIDDDNDADYDIDINIDKDDIVDGAIKEEGSALVHRTFNF